MTLFPLHFETRRLAHDALRAQAMVTGRGTESESQHKVAVQKVAALYDRCAKLSNVSRMCGTFLFSPTI